MFNRNSTLLFATLALLDLTGFENLSGLAHADLSSGLIAYYPFNGNANDESGNGNNGTVYGATLTVDRNGNANSAYSFNGSSDYIDINVPTINTTIGAKVTVSFWMNWSGGVSNPEVMPFGFNYYDVYCSAEYIGFNTGNEDFIGTSNSGLANSWVFITAIFNNGDVALSSLYIDSNNRTLTITSGSPRASTVSINAHISGWPKHDGHRFGGKIDEVRIYNRALSAAEIQQLYLEGTTHQLTITKTGTGMGTVTSNPAGINCSSLIPIDTSTSCNANFTSGTAVTLTATPDDIVCVTYPCGIIWGGWGGACSGVSNTCTVTMDADKNVTANFFFLDAPTVTTLPATNLTPTSAKLNGTVISDGATANVSFDFGTTTAYSQTIAATPAQVYSQSAVAVNAIKTGLTCNTTYHYRITANSDGGLLASYGADKTFITATCPAVNAWLAPPTLTKIRDQVFTLDVIANSNSVKLGSYMFVVALDTTKLVLDSTYQNASGTCSKGVCPGTNAVANRATIVNAAGNTVTLTGDDSAGVGPGNDLQLLVMHLKTKLTTGATPVTLTTSALDATSGETIGLAARGATINVSYGYCGDSDGNTQVNIVDALAIARKLVGLNPPPTVDVTLADVNENARLDINDALMIARYSIGLVIPPEVCAIGQPL